MPRPSHFKPTEQGVYLRTSSSNRSLERGLQILSTFRPGVTLQGNGEIAERTGLPKSTVSRLTQTLVECGYLQYDFNANAYRLGVPLLSLGQAMKQGSEILDIALPLMKDTAEGVRINVGLAVADGNEMVYLESVRRNQSEMFRHVSSGSRVPMELTSLGRAYLASLPARERKAVVESCRARHPLGWHKMLAELNAAMDFVRRHGYCHASWQAGIVSIASSLQMVNHPVYVFNISLSSKNHSLEEIQERFVPLLKKLISQVAQTKEARDRQESGF
jgi:DNA-binding IclR family transcriptional regulator